MIFSMLFVFCTYKAHDLAKNKTIWRKITKSWFCRTRGIRFLQVWGTPEGEVVCLTVYTKFNPNMESI